MPGLTPAELRLAKRRNRFWRGQVWPRRKALLLRAHFWVSAALGVGLALVCEASTTIPVEIREVAGFGMTYSSLSLAACVTGVVLALGLPSNERIARWTAERRDNGFSDYSELVFVLTWAGMAQVLTLLVSIGALVAGGAETLLPEHPKCSHIWLLAGSVAAFFYAVSQLLVLLSTFSQMGNIIDTEGWMNRPSPPPADQPPSLEQSHQ